MEITFFTEHYPFAPGEEFVEAELAYLAAGFDRVHVVPTAAVPARSQPRRELPGNAVLRQDIMEKLRLRRRRSDAHRVAELGLDAACRTLLREEIARPSFWQPPQRAPRRLHRLLQFAGHAIMVRDALREVAVPRFAYAYWLSAAILGASLAGLSPLVARAHGADLYPEADKSRYLPLQEATIRRLRRLVFISDHGLKFATGRFPHLAERFALCRLGVAEAGEAAPSTDGRLHLVSCSRLVPDKRVDRLIDALARFPKPTRWTHLGGGPLAAALRHQAAGLPAHVDVRWLGDCDHNEVLAFYRREPVDLFVNMSCREGLPVSIMEALSFGIPIMAPDVGGIAEVVVPARGILLSAVPSPAETVAKLLQFATHLPGERRIVRQLARAAWASYVNAATQYPLFVELLQQLQR